MEDGRVKVKIEVEMDWEWEPCLICSKLVTSFSEDKLLPAGLDVDYLLGDHLWQIFLLRKVLQLPLEECENLFRESCGMNPGTWFRVCGPCCQMVNATFLLHSKIIKLEWAMEQLKKKVKGKLSKSLELGKDTWREEEKSVRTTVRCYFTNHPQQEESEGRNGLFAGGGDMMQEDVAPTITSTASSKSQRNRPRRPPSKKKSQEAVNNFNESFHQTDTLCPTPSSYQLIQEPLLAPKKKRFYDLAFKLEVLKFAEKNSGEATARKFQIDSRQVRAWRKQKAELFLAASRNKKSRKRLPGQGSKPKSEKMENQLMDWIREAQGYGIKVSHPVIRKKAQEIFQQIEENKSKSFCASKSWLRKFLLRYKNSSQYTASLVINPSEGIFDEKVNSFLLFTAQKRSKFNISPENIIAMDEIVVVFDISKLNPSGSTSSGSAAADKFCATVVLAAQGNGVKLKPFIVFDNTKLIGETLENDKSAKITLNQNSWMSEDLTCLWLDEIYRKKITGKRLLIWDSYHCHLSPKSESHLQGFNTITAAVPSGCPRFLQAANISWKTPFKNRIKEMFQIWLDGARNEHPVSEDVLNKRLVVDWVVKSWNELDPSVILNSFKTSGLTVALDGSEDSMIECMQVDRPCHTAVNQLADKRLLMRVAEHEIQLVNEVDEEQGEGNESGAYQDSEEDEDSNCDD